MATKQQLEEALKALIPLLEAVREFENNYGAVLREYRQNCGIVTEEDRMDAAIKLIRKYSNL